MTIPHRSRRYLAAGALLAVVAAAPAATPADPDPLALPDFGSSADTVMSRTEQRELGQEFMKWVHKSLPVSADPLLTDYIETLGHQLVTVSGNGGSYDFFLIEDPTVNAFAGPDGHVGVYAGLVLAAQTEGELAAVLSHEIAHVSQNHLMRSFEAQRQMTLPATALLIAAAVLGAAVDAEMGAAAIAGISGVAAQSQINFTRANEEEADRIGIETLARAGHDPFAMPGFFQRLSKSARVYENGAPEYLRTHPVNSNRIADALGRASQYGHRQRPDSLRFQLARADLRQRSYDNASKAIDHFKETLGKGRYRDAAAEHYGYALALARGGRFDEAGKEASRLLAQYPSQTEFVVLKANIDRRSGRPEQAIRDLKGAVGLAPGNWPLNQAYAEALLAARQPKEALAALTRFIGYRPDLPSIYELMADAAGKAGARAQSFQYRGEYLYRTGDLEPAIRQLELALRVPGIQSQLADRIQVRLEELRAEERRREKKGERRKEKS